MAEAPVLNGTAVRRSSDQVGNTVSETRRAETARRRFGAVPEAGATWRPTVLLTSQLSGDVDAFLVPDAPVSLADPKPEELRWRQI